MVGPAMVASVDRLKPIFHLANLFVRTSKKVGMIPTCSRRIFSQANFNQSRSRILVFASRRANKVAKWKIGFSNRLPCLSGDQFKFRDRRIPPKDNPSSILSPKIGRVENFRRHFETTGLSTTDINLLTKSVKTSTSKAWNCSWSQWSSWCEERENDPVLGKVSEVLIRGGKTAQDD